MQKRALVVDNDFFFVEFLSEILEKHSYDVSKAYDGKEGIAKLEEAPVDAIFVDMVMPKIDGRQFIEFARRRYPDTPFPIVAISGILIEQLDRLKELGANFFLAKGPLDKMTIQIDQLLEKIEMWNGEEHTPDNAFDQSDLYPRMETQELIENINFYRGIIGSIGIGVVVVDTDARIITVNPLGLKMLDRTIETVLNRPIVSMFAETDRPEIVSAIKRILKQPEVSKITFVATLRSHPVTTTVSLFRSDRKVSGFIIALEDPE